MKKLIFLAVIFNAQTLMAQNVGIGTTTPLTKLHVSNGASGATPFAISPLTVESNGHTFINLLSPAANETGILFGIPGIPFDGAIDYNNVNTANGFQFRTNGNLTRMVIDNAGNVGIGTIGALAPAAKLEIIHNGASTNGTALLINQNVIGNADGPKIQFKKTMTSPKSWTAGILNGIDLGTFGISEDGGTGGFGNPRFAIAQGGNVGIGTTSPNQRLSVTSGDDARVNIYSNGGSVGIIDAVSNANTATARWLSINPSGANVGIGTQSPTAQLSLASAGTELAGTAMSNSFKTNAGSLGGTIGNEISIASLGFLGANNIALGIRGYRSSTGTDWTSTSILLGYDVDNTVRPASFFAMGSNGNFGFGIAAPAASAKLDVTSTTSGFLPPRMTTAQRDAIASPVPGLMVFNSSTQTIDYYSLYGWSSLKVVIAGGNKLLGGTADETTPSIQKTTDGGYIVAGTSTSSANGDVTGTNHGQSDIWIAKVNSAGSLSWNKLLGGDFSEYAFSIQQTTDGGYIVAGTSTSSANGDVTGTNHSAGDADYWIIKLDGTGNIVWNKLLGGSLTELAYSIQQTTDGGYIVAGESTSSANGDVTGANHGNRDYWIVKLDGSGNIVWNKLLGGTGNDIAYSIQQTTDGGYIVAGTSTSSANGDVTGTNHGVPDYWIVKLDGSGIIVWNKLLGGANSEVTKSIVQTTDGGYIVAGYSISSANGDVTGTTHGAYDFWIVKLDGSGNIVWNKLLGGSLSEFAYSIQQTTDGGYIVAGYSNTLANGDVSGVNHGGNDYWIVKLDGSGNIEWNKLLGGSGNDIAYSVQQTADGGYIVAGTSTSSANADVTSSNHGAGTDFWIIRLDANGNIL